MRIYIYFSLDWFSLCKLIWPPVIVIITDGPQDLQAYFIVDGEYVEGDRMVKDHEVLFELKEYAHFTYPSEIEGIKFISSNESFYIALGTIEKYNNIFTLDFDKQNLKEGKSIFRTIKLVSYRLFSTLLLEGLIFALFKYKNKRSWLVFLGLNLITQSFLNIALNSELPTVGRYLMFSLVFYELIIFLSEAVAMSILIREKKTWITLIYVTIANISSLILGMCLYPLLPI